MPPRSAQRSASPAARRRRSPATLSRLLSPPPPEPVATSASYAKGASVSPRILGGFWGISNIASMLICGGLVAAGVFGAADARLWLACFARLFAGLAALTLGGAAVVAAACRLCGRKLQPEGRTTPPILVEALDSLRAMWVFAALAAWPAAAWASGARTGLVFSLAEAMPGWGPRAALAGYLVQLVALTLLVDVYSHFKHKAMHTTLLFEFHKTHHTFRDPSPFAAFAVHPVEAFLTFVPVLGILRHELPVWAHAYAVWTITWFFINLCANCEQRCSCRCLPAHPPPPPPPHPSRYLHSGYEIDLLERIMGPLWINSSAYHNHHHELMYTNYSELLYICDFILGTGFHPTGYGYGRRTPKFGSIRPRL